MAETEKKHAGGRPTKYQDHTEIAVEYMAEAGMTDKQMAARIGITEQAFNNWKKEHAEFFESLKKGKDKADDKVEKSLFKNATGYNYKAHKPMSVSDGAGAGSHVEIVDYIEHVPAQTVAQIFWLKNRRPEKWRDVNQNYNYNMNKDTKELTPEENKEYKKQLAKAFPLLAKEDDKTY